MGEVGRTIGVVSEMLAKRPERVMAHAIAGCWVCKPDGRCIWSESAEPEKNIQAAADHHKQTGHACWADVTYHDSWGVEP